MKTRKKLLAVVLAMLMAVGFGVASAPQVYADVVESTPIAPFHVDNPNPPPPTRPPSCTQISG